MKDNMIPVVGIAIYYLFVFQNQKLYLLHYVQ